MMVVVALIVAAVAVLGAVVALALGRGGELAETHPDHPPLPIPTARPITGPEVAMLSLPRGLWGYHVGMTDEALHRVAYALAERDARVTLLEQQVADLRHRLGERDAAGDGDWAAPGDPYGPAYDEVPAEDEVVAEEAVTVVDEPADAGDDGFEEELFDGGESTRHGPSEPVVLAKQPKEEQ